MTQSEQLSTRETNPGRLDSETATDLVNQVFQLFKAHWPRKFPSIWPSDEGLVRSKRAWHKKFRACPWLTEETLGAGLSRVTDLQWPPDNPGEFLDLCHVTPELARAPNFDAAFTEACRGAYPYNTWHRWSHRCVYWAATWTGLSDLNERPNAKRKAFDREYQRALDQHRELEPAPEGKLPAKLPDIGPESDEARESAMAEIREKLGGGDGCSDPA